MKKNRLYITRSIMDNGDVAYQVNLDDMPVCPKRPGKELALSVLKMYEESIEIKSLHFWDAIGLEFKPLEVL